MIQVPINEWCESSDIESKLESEEPNAGCLKAQNSIVISENKKSRLDIPVKGKHTLFYCKIIVFKTLFDGNYTQIMIISILTNRQTHSCFELVINQ